MAGLNSGFLGRGWAFPPSFDAASGEVSMVEGERDIRDSLRVLFSTIPGERLMLPGYGSDLHLHIFDGIDETNLTQIKSVIADAVLYYEPRIRLDAVEVSVIAQSESTLEVTLIYTVRATNSRANMVFPFYFSEGTQLERP